MIKVAAGTTLGLLLGSVMAALVAPYVGIAGFSGHSWTITVGYACSVSLGVAMGFVASRQDKRWSPSASVMTSAMIGVLVTYLLRALPLPWLNLVWLDGTSGPAGELPFVVLPAVGILLGGIWGSAARSLDPEERRAIR